MVCLFQLLDAQKIYTITPKDVNLWSRKKLTTRVTCIICQQFIHISWGLYVVVSKDFELK